MPKIMIFKHSGKIPSEVSLPENMSFTLWKPKWNDFKPIYYPKKYFIYWIFHYIGVFQNNKYRAFQVFHNNQLVSSLLVVPSYYRWQFMKKSDVQLTYVVTMQNYRGQGLALINILETLKILYKLKIESIWYVTESDNLSSLKLAEKAGFVFEGYGLKKKYFTGYSKLWLTNDLLK